MGCLGDGFIGQHFLFSWTVFLVLLCSVQFSELELGFPAVFCFIAGIFVSPMCFFAYIFLFLD